MTNQQKLTYREQLKAKMAADSRQLETLVTRREQLRRECLEAKNRAEGLARSAETYPSKQGEADAEQQRFERLNADLEHVQTQIDDLQRNIDSDKAALAAFCVEVTAAEIVDQQNDILTDEQKANDWKRLIAEQQTIIDAAQGLEDTAAPLKKQRGQLQAEAATGIDHGKKLAALETEITKAEQADIAANQVRIDLAGKATETKAALEDMLASLNRSIVVKRHNQVLLQDSLLDQWALEALGKYQAAAKQVADSLHTMAAIDSVIATLGIRHRSGVLPEAQSAQQIVLPGIGDLPKNPAGLFLRTMTGITDEASREALLNRLKAQGIEV
ncbi:hypothetical protein QZJ86_11155 [Methylomonas montana]|uniref:hypothetical protein n=1 Tax=Methylomonas montana TaxID=3058963 RepID=UPI00265841AB|nr:hypothetical protein [Methylomonas montana]WKJ88583.1 hypothetical protein QZJ86_11155 [Methylomonas montana]